MNEYNQYITKYSILCVLFQAANYLNIEGLLELACQTVAGMMNDYTCEEEEAA